MESALKTEVELQPLPPRLPSRAPPGTQPPPSAVAEPHPPPPPELPRTPLSAEVPPKVVVEPQLPLARVASADMPPVVRADPLPPPPPPRTQPGPAPAPPLLWATDPAAQSPAVAEPRPPATFGHVGIPFGLPGGLSPAPDAAREPPESTPTAPDVWPQASIGQTARGGEHVPPVPPWFDQLDRKMEEPSATPVADQRAVTEASPAPFDQVSPETDEVKAGERFYASDEQIAEALEQALGEAYGKQSPLKMSVESGGFGPSGPGETFGNQGFAGPSFDNRPFGPQAFGDQGLGDHGLAHQAFGDQGLGDQGFGHPTFGDQVLGDQSFGHQAFGDQGLGNQSFGDQPAGAQSFNDLYGDASSGELPLWEPVFGEQVYGDQVQGEYGTPEYMPPGYPRPDYLPAEYPPSDYLPSEYLPAPGLYGEYSPDARLDYRPSEHLRPEPFPSEQPEPPLYLPEEELRPAPAVWKQAHPSARRWAAKRQRQHGVARAPSPPRIASGLLLAGLGVWLLLSFLPSRQPLTESERIRISHQAGVDENAWRFPPAIYPAAQGGAALYVSLGFLIALRGLFFRRRIEVSCRRCRRVVVAERHAVALRCESGRHSAGINWGALLLQLAVLGVTLGLIVLVVMAKLNTDFGLGLGFGG